MANPTPHSPLERSLHALAILASFAGKETIGRYLDQLSRIVAVTSDDPAQFDSLTAEINEMVASGRDPSADEVQAVRDRRHQLEAEVAAGEQAAPPSDALT